MSNLDFTGHSDGPCKARGKKYDFLGHIVEAPADQRYHKAALQTGTMIC